MLLVKNMEAKDKIEIKIIRRKMFRFNLNNTKLTIKVIPTGFK